MELPGLLPRTFSSPNPLSYAAQQPFRLPHFEILHGWPLSLIEGVREDFKKFGITDTSVGLKLSPIYQWVKGVISCEFDHRGSFFQARACCVGKKMDCPTPGTSLEGPVLCYPTHLHCGKGGWDCPWDLLRQCVPDISVLWKPITWKKQTTTPGTSLKDDSSAPITPEVTSPCTAEAWGCCRLAKQMDYIFFVTDHLQCTATPWF